MHSFTDNNDRTWAIEITVSAIKRVKAVLDIDLLAGGKIFERIADDPVLLCDLLFVLCRADTTVTDEDFGQAMAGDVLDAASLAFMEALADFFPSRRRALMHKTIAKIDDLQVIAMDVVEAKLDSPSLEAKLRQYLQTTLGETSTASPAASGSTPDP